MVDYTFTIEDMTTEERIDIDAMNAAKKYFDEDRLLVDILQAHAISERNKTIDEVRECLKSKGFDFEIDYNGRIISEALESLKV